MTVSRGIRIRSFPSVSQAPTDLREWCTGPSRLSVIIVSTVGQNNKGQKNKNAGSLPYFSVRARASLPGRVVAVGALTSDGSLRAGSDARQGSAFRI